MAPDFPTNYNIHKYFVSFARIVRAVPRSRYEPRFRACEHLQLRKTLLQNPHQLLFCQSPLPRFLHLSTEGSNVYILS